MIKVEHTKTHQTNPLRSNTLAAWENTDVLVTDAKLVLVECTSIDGLFNKYLGDPLVLHDKKYGAGRKYYKPILISESEKIEVGDWVYNEVSKEIYQFKENHVSYEKKILSLPEHFSPKQLQAIVDGKLKDGDKVLIECEQSTVAAWAGPNMIRKHGSGIFGIKLYPHITIYPIEEKTIPLSEVRIIAEKAAKQAAFYGWYTPERFKEWFEQNVK